MTMRSAAAMHAALCTPHVTCHHISAMPMALPRPSAKQTRSSARSTRNHASDAPDSAELVSSGDAGATALATNREGYRSFVMQGCEFLVRQTPEGALALADTFVLDAATGSSEKANFSGDIPSEPCLYQPAEIAIEYPGNILDARDETRTVLKVYLTAITSQEPYRVDLERIFLLDGGKKSLEKLSVQRLAPADTPDHELRARIRDRWVIIDTATSIPSPEEAVQAALVGGTAPSRLEKEARERGEQVGPNAGAAADGEHSGNSSDGSEYDEYESDEDYEDLKDFLVEVNDEEIEEYEDMEYDQPASDY